MPLGVGGADTLHRVEVALLQGDRDLARLAGPDLAVVDLADGRHLRGSASEERLVGEVELVAGDRRLLDGDAVLAGEREDGVAGDAGEDAAGQRRGDELALLDDEQVLAGAFADVAVHVRQDGLVVAAELRLALGEDAVRVLTGHFRLRQAHADVVPMPRADLATNARRERLGAEVRPPFPGDDEAAVLVVGRVDAHRPVGDVDHRPEVRLVHPVGAGQRDVRVVDLRPGEFRLQKRELARVEEAIGVGVQPEHGGPSVGPFVGPHALERRDAVVKAVREHRETSAVPVHELAVHPDLLRLVDHGR